MLGKKLADPTIFTFISTDDDDEVVASNVVCMEKVCDYLEEAETAGYYEEGVFFTELVEYVLLEFLWEWSTQFY
jgi:hypothetical protein